MSHAKSYFKVKTSHDGQLLHGQLFCGFLVTMATTAFDFSTAAEVLWSSKPTKVSMKGSAVRKLWQRKSYPVLTHTELPAQTVSERRRSCGVALSIKD